MIFIGVIAKRVEIAAFRLQPLGNTLQIYPRSSFRDRRLPSRHLDLDDTICAVCMSVLGCRLRAFPVHGRRTAARTCQCSRSAPWPTSCSPGASTRATYLTRSRTPPAWASTRPVAPGTRHPATTRSTSR